MSLDMILFAMAFAVGIGSLTLIGLVVAGWTKRKQAIGPTKLPWWVDAVWVAAASTAFIGAFIPGVFNPWTFVSTILFAFCIGVSAGVKMALGILRQLAEQALAKAASEKAVKAAKELALAMAKSEKP